MDFLTAIPYLGIILIAIINALLVRYRDISIEEEEEPES